MAYAMAASCSTWRASNGWATEPEGEAAEGTRLARRALDLGPDDPDAICHAGDAIARLGGDLDAGALRSGGFIPAVRAAARGP